MCECVAYDVRAEAGLQGRVHRNWRETQEGCECVWVCACGVRAVRTCVACGVRAGRGREIPTDNSTGSCSPGTGDTEQVPVRLCVC